jgi:aerobic-type carbon monoxide dehydrogenase small subunit (CoxS/CutS family)
MSELALTINGQSHTAHAAVGVSLARVLREELGFTGTKIARRAVAALSAE